MMLSVLALACAMVVSVSGCYEVTKAKVDTAIQQTGAQNIAVVKLQYHSEIGANVLVVVVVEGEKYRGIPMTVPGTMPFVEPQEGASVNAAAEGEYYTMSVPPTSPPRFTGTKQGETIVGGVTEMNSAGERVVIVAQFDSELDEEQLATARTAAETFLNSL